MVGRHGIVHTEVSSPLPAPRKWAIRFCLLLGLRHYEGWVIFQEVLTALVEHNYRMQYTMVYGEQSREIEQQSLATTNGDLKRVLIGLDVLQKKRRRTIRKSVDDTTGGLSKVFSLQLIDSYVQEKKIRQGGVFRISRAANNRAPVKLTSKKPSEDRHPEQHSYLSHEPELRPLGEFEC